MDENEVPQQIYTYGENIIWCKEKCISGKKFYFMIFGLFSYTIPLVAMLVIIFLTKKSSSFLFTIIWMFILFSIEVFATFRAGCTDPGILPKQYIINGEPKKNSPIKRVIRGHIYDIKYCPTCDIFRPPRSSHCFKCDNCVQQFDHHCDWLGNDIGKRNYKFFYLLVFCLFIEDLYQIGFCIYFLLNHLIKEKNDYDDKTIKLIVTSLSIIMLYDLLFLLFFLGKLFFLHTYLCSSNLSYYEYFKKKLKKYPVNPYNISFFYNFNHIFCKRARKSIFLDKPYNNLEEEVITIKKKEINIQKKNSMNISDKKHIIDTTNEKQDNNNEELNSEIRKFNQKQNDKKDNTNKLFIE